MNVLGQNKPILVVRKKLSNEHKLAQTALVDACFMVYINYYLALKTGSEEAMTQFCGSLKHVQDAAKLHEALNDKAAQEIHDSGEYDQLLAALKTKDEPKS